MLETHNFALRAACLTLAAAATLTSGLALAAPPANTPVPAPFQDSYKVYLEMKAKAVAPKRVPDWSGLWTRNDGPPFPFDSKQPLPLSAGKITAELTPKYDAMYRKRLRDVAAGREWDPQSDCLPSGFPRWLTEPFLREVIITPKETWWIQEQQNEIRRIYTDGRGHMPEDEAYPLWEGDSIGFWDGGTLVVHTIRVKANMYNREQPDYSDQTSAVERIRLRDRDTMEDEVTVWDPLSLKKPWHVVQLWGRVTEPDIRMDEWSCEEDRNVAKNPDGSTQLLLPGDPGYLDPNRTLIAPGERQ